MNYHDIRTDDMLNGSGLRVVLFVAGCHHYCTDCHNQETWDSNSGEVFGTNQKNEIFNELAKDYIEGITFSGGDPLADENVREVYLFIQEIKKRFPNKTIWLYTGYCFEDILKNHFSLEQADEYRYGILKEINVLVDGQFISELADVNYPWAGSTNQRIIDMQQTFYSDKVILYANI